MRFPIELTTQNILCSELNMAQYKDILKVTYGEPSADMYIDVMSEIISKLTGIEKNAVLKFNVVDFFLIILEIRTFSLGNVCKIVVQLDETQKATVDLSLTGIKQDIKKIDHNKFTSTIDQGNFQVIVSPPSVSRLIEEESDEYLYGIDKFIDNDKRTIDITDSKMANSVLNVLTPKNSLRIIHLFNEYVEEVTKVNLLARYGLKQNLSFVPNISTLIWFTKLFFNESLGTLYDNLFYLSCKGHMSPSYIEQCSPGEYIYFVKKLQQMLHSQQENENQTQGDYGDHTNDGKVDLGGEL